MNSKTQSANLSEAFSILEARSPAWGAGFFIFRPGESMAFEVGQKAPAFTLMTETGDAFSILTALQAGPVLLVFYPGDFTPVCTKQLCGYRDGHDEFARLGVQVVGISADDSGKHQRFKAQYVFPFPLLTDPGKRLAKSLGLTSKFMFGAVSRANVIIARDGTVLYKQVEAVALTYRSSGEILKVLAELKASGKI